MKKIKILLAVTLFILSNSLVAQVGINSDGSAPETSAMLDVKSSNKGFLPPRLTNSEIVAINNPAEGLIVYNSTTHKPVYYNGSQWSYFNETEMHISIGDYVAGGIVFYLDGAGGGMVCAISDQSTAADWGCEGTEISGADGTAIGTGIQNTLDIVAGCATPGIAAHICDTLTLNGYNDWSLPSKDGLHEMFLNNAIINGTAMANGGSAFAYAYYCSSSEASGISAWFQYMQPGVDVQTLSNKSGPHRVRAVRAF